MSSPFRTESFKLEAAECAVAGSTRASGEIPTSTATPIPITPTQPHVRGRSRTKEPRLGPKTQNTHTDPAAWQETCEQFGPTGFIPKEYATPAMKSPLKSPMLKTKRRSPAVLKT